MFASHELVIDATYELVAARLVHLVDRGALNGVSKAAYEGQWEAVVRVGPLGGTLGLSKLVRVRVLDPVRHGATMIISLRWEAIGPAGELFPALDADLLLTPEGEDGSRLGLVGSYRPPLGRAGAALDNVIMNRLAVATVHSFLQRLASAVADPMPEPSPVLGVIPLWRPSAEPGHP